MRDAAGHLAFRDADPGEAALPGCGGKTFNELGSWLWHEALLALLSGPASLPAFVNSQPPALDAADCGGWMQAALDWLSSPGTKLLEVPLVKEQQQEEEH